MNISDMLTAFGVRREWALHGLFELACWLPARRFAQEVHNLDRLIGATGLATGGAWMLGQRAGQFTVSGPRPPGHGPLLLVSNHPGLLDSMALFAAIGREDLRVLAISRPFLRCLPNINAALIPVGATSSERVAALRMAARHVRAGGAALTFPAGRIEPDPLITPTASAALEHWSESIGTFARLAGSAPIVPVIVAGVTAPAALHHPVVRLRQDPEDRRWLAAIWQLLRPELGRVHVRVHFGRPIDSRRSDLIVSVQTEARRVIEELRRS